MDRMRTSSVSMVPKILILLGVILVHQQSAFSCFHPHELIVVGIAHLVIVEVTSIEIQNL